MNSTNNDNEFSNLFEFSNQVKEDKHEARLLMYRFLSEVERMSAPKRGLKKLLASGINKSSSYITQLFNGDKLINLTTLAKFQRILKIKFKIIAYPENQFYDSSSSPNMQHNIFILQKREPSEEATEGSKESGVFTQVVEKSEPALS